METFLQALPKVELHAHLNGSLNTNAIRELSELVYGSSTADFIDLSKRLTDFQGVGLDECFQKFKLVHELTSTRKGLHMATLLVIREFAKDNIIYLELRTTPKKTEQMSKREYLECVLEAIVCAQESFGSVQVKLLPSIDRSQPVKQAEETLEAVLELLKLHPNIIKGIDLSGNPNCGEFKKFVPVLSRARQNGLKLALHCGENDNPKEIAEMLEFGMDRCGHGTFLNDQDLKRLGRHNIAVECCLTSNVKCKTVSKYKNHHFQRIFQCKNAVVLCTDDCGVFDTTMTQEFIIATTTFNLKKNHIFQLTQNAVEHAFADNIEKLRLFGEVSNYFKKKL